MSITARTLSLAAAIALGIATVRLLWLLGRPLALLVLAVTLAAALAPAAAWLDRRMPRTLAVALVYLVLFGAVAIAAALVLPQLTQELDDLFARAPDMLSRLHSRMTHVLPAGREFQDALTGAVRQLLERLATLPLQVLSGAFELLVLVFLSLYFLIAGPRVQRFLASLVPERRRGFASPLAAAARVIVLKLVAPATRRATRTSRPAVASAMALAVLSSACHEELGIKTGPAKERVEVAELELEGVESMDEDKLRTALETEESSWLPWGENEYFDRATFDADLKRIQAFYEDHGYPHARIAATDVRLDEQGDAVRIRIVVSEGQPVRVAELAFSGFDPLGAEGLQELRERVPLQPGDPVARHALLQADEIATTALQNLGYAYAQVDLSTESVAPDRLRIVARASPGILTYFGPIEIAGNASVDDGVIRRYLSYRPGDMFQLRPVQESQRRLYALGLFQFANVEVLNPRPDVGEVGTRVTVAERDHRQFEFSVGYGTEEKLRGEAEWRHVNFFGGARQASVHGRMSWLERGLEGRFVQPYLFRPGLSLTLRGHGWYADEPAYTVLSRGGRVIVEYERGPRVVSSVTYMHELESSRVADEALLDPELRDDLISLGLNPTTGEQDGVVSAVMFDVTRQTNDSVLDPKRGYVASFRIEQAGGWLPGTFNYTNTVFEGRAYRGIADVTLAGRARYGAIAPMGPDSDVPFFKRYFLGGADSLRGWGRYQVSPLSGFGLPIGGHTFLEASGEVRVRLPGKLGAVAFVDAGNVWADDWELNVRDLLYDAGAGLRYDTPIGPLRFDAAYQLTPLEGLRVDGELQDRRWRVHFSIGQAF